MTDDVKGLVEALLPFARVADMSQDMLSGHSVYVNIDRCRDARRALEALYRDNAGEQKVVEPVAWRWSDGGGYNAEYRYSEVDPREDEDEVERRGASCVGTCIPLYASPAPDDVRRMALEEVDFPKYGGVSFEDLGLALNGARYDKLDAFEFDDTYNRGHQPVPFINFNSLNRIVTWFLDRAALRAPGDKEPKT